MQSKIVSKCQVLTTWQAIEISYLRRGCDAIYQPYNNPKIIFSQYFFDKNIGPSLFEIYNYILAYLLKRLLIRLELFWSKKFQKKFLELLEL